MADPVASIPLIVIVVGWMLAGGSPGPATLAISGTSMQQGRIAALTLAAGIVVGSASWGVAAGLGFSALMLANAWMFEIIRYAGAAYLMFLALKSLRAGLMNGRQAPRYAPRKALFLKGLLLHVTNPKAVLSWGAIYAIALPSGAGTTAVWSLFATLICASMVVFFGYALLFSWAPIAKGYERARRWFELALAALFGLASLKILTARLT